MTCRLAVERCQYLPLCGAIECMTEKYLLNPAFVLMIAANVVIPPLGTEFKKALMKQNQN